MPLTSAYSPVVLVATEVIVSPPFVGSPDVAPSSLHLHDEWRWQKSTMSRCSTKKPWPQPARARGSERLSTHRQSSFQIWAITYLTHIRRVKMVGGATVKCPRLASDIPHFDT